MTRAPLVVGVVLSLSLATIAAEDLFFPTPSHNGYRLDVCRTWGQGCGQDAADAFCRTQGFDRAQSFVVDPKIGAKTPTMTLDDRKVCDQPACDGFKSITCTRANAPAGRGRLKMPPPQGSQTPPPPQAPPAQQPPPPPQGQPPTRNVGAVLSALKAVVASQSAGSAGQAQPQSSVPPAQPSPGTLPSGQKTEPGDTPPSHPGQPGSHPASGVEMSYDPDEFVVVYPKSKQGTLGRFGKSAAAGQLEEERPVTLAVRSDQFQAAPGDFDGDGQTDLALLEHLSAADPGKVELSFLRYDDAAGFTSAKPPQKLSFGSGFPVLTAGRFLGTAHHEVLIYSPGGAAVVISHELGTVPVQWNSHGVLVVLDADGDGTDDLLDYAEPAGTLELVSLDLTDTNDGKRLAAIRRQLPTQGPGRRFGVGDFTGDGRSDLLIHDSASGSVSMLQFTPKGGVAKSTTVDAGWAATTVWTAGRDYDGDKHDDLLIADPAAAAVHLVRFTAGGTLREKQLVSTMKAGTLFFPGQFTGTGRASYIAMARDLKNKLVHVQFSPDAKAHPDGPIVAQLPDGGILFVGNFARGR